MKKLLAILLCICLAVPTAALASDKAMIGFDKASKQDTTAVLPVYITDVPDGLANISTLTFHFAYDNSILEFVSISDGAITSMSGRYNQPDMSVGAVRVSWYDASDGNINAIERDETSKNNPLFYVEFNILDTSAEYAFINIEKASVSDYELNKSTNETLGTVAGVVMIAAYTGSGDDNTGDDTNGDDTTGDDNTGDDNTGDDTTGDDTTGDNTSGDDTTDDDNDSSGSTGEGPLKPAPDNTGNGGNDSGNSSNNSGNSSNNSGTSSNPGSGSKPSGGNTGGGSVTPVTPATPVVPATPKASELFSDVADSHWAAASVVKLSQLGIVSGDNQKRANLDNRITRAETSKLALLVNSIKVQSGLALDVKDSADVPDWAKDYMATAIAEGIFSGYEDGTVKPKNNITRTEMVAVIIKSLGVAVVSDPALSFADNGAIGWAAPYVETILGSLCR